LFRNELDIKIDGFVRSLRIDMRLLSFGHRWPNHALQPTPMVAAFCFRLSQPRRG
jgi:hypothetical protein